MEQLELKIQLPNSKAYIAIHEWLGALTKSLVVELDPPRQVLLTQDGYLASEPFKHVRAICNHYRPNDSWKCVQSLKDEYFNQIAILLGHSRSQLGFLFTAADVERCLGLGFQEFRGFQVAVLATAGFSNALRIGIDPASYYELDGEFHAIPGTINILLITNAQLTRCAMVRSLITLTEAKTVALQDLDLRSSFNPAHQATGTGTDNIAVIPGLDRRIEYVGGHAKLGEIIAKASIQAIKQAASRWSAELGADPSC